MPPEKIPALRLRENASQAVFARHLNVTAGLVSQWEPGEKRPRGASLKLLTLGAKNGLGAVVDTTTTAYLRMLVTPFSKRPSRVLVHLLV